MLFDELMNSQRMEDPEERHAQPIQRVEAKSKFKRTRSSSVSGRTFRWSIRVLTVLLSLGLIAGIVAVVVYGVRLFIGG